jgi:hypothetical protein
MTDERIDQEVAARELLPFGTASESCAGSCPCTRWPCAEILMCANTLSAVVAIRAWLEAHGIRVAG